MIIDAHAHVTSGVRGLTGSGPTRPLAYGKVQWGDKVIRMTPPLSAKTAFPPEVLLEYMDWAGVDRAVLLQGSFYGEANAYVADAVRQWPGRFAGAAFIDPRGPDPEGEFRRCVDDFGFRILKFEMSVAAGLVGLYPDLRLDSDEFAWLFAEAERLGLVVTLDLGAVGSASYQTVAVKTILKRHPGLRIVIAHLGQPPIGSTDAALDEAWREQILLGKNPNVWFDLSALPVFSEPHEDYPYALAQAYIQSAIDLIGAHKLMWGSDAPGLLSQASYRRLLDFVGRHFPFDSDSHRDTVLGGTAATLYGFV